MHQIRRLLRWIILSTFISLWISHAWSMSLSPSTWSFGMRCIYPISFSVNVSGIESKAVDMRVIYSWDSMQFTGDWTGQITYGTYLVRTGTTTVAIDLGWASYIAGSKYRLFNRTDLITPLSGVSDISYYTRYFQTTANVLTWYLDFYYSGGWNGDDSNIQSGIVNNFIDVLDTINSWYYDFVARPCIPDTDAPIYTWYSSGADVSYLSWISFTVYDFTGLRISGYNSTYHYRWDGPVYVNYNDYTWVGLLDIDNQYWVNSWTIIVGLSWLSFESSTFTGESGWYYSWWTLVYTSFTLSSLNSSDLFDCTPISTTLEMWNTLTWNRLDRGYDCILTSTGLVGFSGVQLDSNQTIQVTITGVDNLNYRWILNTWVISFPITINGIDNTPPYIVLGDYQWTGALNGFNTTWAGPSFSSEQRSGREYWTKDDTEIHLTWSEIIIMTNVVGFSGTDLNVYISWGNGYSGINQTLIFTGNMTGFVTFQDIPMEGMDPNYGQTYVTGWTNYTYDFNIDVFRIDRITTEITWSLAYTGENGQLHRATLTLTGFATGNADSIMDDEFIIYAYSGVGGSSNTPNVTYTGWYDSWAYSLYHTNIVFNDNRTGYIYYRDRANNAWEMYVNVTGIELAATYTIIAVPSNREDLSSYALSNSWVISRFSFVSGYNSSDWFLQRSWDVVFSWLIKTSSTGIYTFDYGFASGTYALIFESQSHVSTVRTWLVITGARIFNVTQTWDMVWDAAIWASRLIAWDLLLFQIGQSTLTTNSVKDGEVNASDIWAILTWVQMTWWYQIYSGGFHVWTGTELVTADPLSGRLPFVQYHPWDVNADGDIKSTDIAIINANLDNRSVRTRANTTFFDIFD